MNIIIKTDKSVRITQYDATDSTPIDIQNITVHIVPSLSPAYLSLVCREFIDGDEEDFKTYKYNVNLTQIEDQLTPNYDDYACTSSTKIITKPYNLSVVLDDGTAIEVAKSVMITNNNIQDEHPPIMIHSNRKISCMNRNTLVQEDSLSQVIRFSIEEYYDGVSFLDSTKEIYVDYIPPNFVPQNNESFLSDKITSREKDTHYPGRILLSWLVPPAVTVEAGEVTYAISVINTKERYIWQTQTSTLNILPNIGKRPEVPVIPDIPDAPDEPDTPDVPVEPGDTSELTRRVAELENFVANIDYVSDIDAATGTITHVTRENGEQIVEEHEVDDLYANSTKNSVTILSGGGANG